jgi:hypothetical protein
MASTQNSELVRQLFEEVFNNGNLDRLEDFYSPKLKMNAYWYSGLNP